MLGVNPWTLMVWMGHKRIEETMRYVHVAQNHMRPIPEHVLKAGEGETDPDRRIIKTCPALISRLSWRSVVIREFV